MALPTPLPAPVTTAVFIDAHRQSARPREYRRSGNQEFLGSCFVQFREHTVAHPPSTKTKGFS
jgi:hypothetical protein